MVRDRMAVKRRKPLVQRARDPFVNDLFPGSTLKFRRDIRAPKGRAHLYSTVIRNFLKGAVFYNREGIPAFLSVLLPKSR